MAIGADTPDAPAMINVTMRRPTSVVIKVTPPDNNGGMPILGYRVQYNDVSYDHSTGKPGHRCVLIIVIIIIIIIIIIVSIRTKSTNTEKQ